MSKKSAILLILLGGSCMSFVGLCIRLIDQADGFQILVYRSISLSIMVAAVSCLRRRISPIDFLRRLDLHDLQMGAALGIAFSTYVFSMLYTSVASTLFILTISPFIAAIVAWVWLSERPHPFTWITMLVATAGVILMISDGIELGRTLGNLLALAAASFFALMLVLARRSKKPDVLGGTFLGGVFSGLIGIAGAVTIGNGLEVNTYDLSLILFMGAFTIGIGIALLTTGTPYVPTAEVAVLTLIESVLGPIWVWVFLSESMSLPEITGGALVLLSVALLAKLTAKSDRLA